MPNNGYARKLETLNLFATDAVLGNWLASIPDLDKRQQEENLKEVLQDFDFGATEEDRAKRLARAGGIAPNLNGAGLVLALGALTILLDWFPSYYWWLIAALAALPVLAVMIVIASRGHILYRRQGHTEHGPAKSFRAFSCCRRWRWRSGHGSTLMVFDWQLALQTSGAFGFSGRTCFADSAQQEQIFWDFSGPAVSTGLRRGVTVFYNSYFDKSVPSVFPARIAGMRKDYGKSTSSLPQA